MTGIPIYNCNNNCSTGANTIMLAKQLVEAGSDCILAVGFEKMQPGSLTSMVNDILYLMKSIISPFQKSIISIYICINIFSCASIMIAHSL